MTKGLHLCLNCSSTTWTVGVVYWIPCGTCGRAYIGQPGRILNQRLKEHKRALTSENLAQSAIEERAMEEMHVTDWKEAHVVDSHSHYHNDAHWRHGTSGQRGII